MNTLLTLEEFKILSPSSNLTDDQIQMYLEIMTETVHSLAGISLEEGEITESLKGNNQSTLYLKKRPVKDILNISGNKNIKLTDITVNLYKNGVSLKKGIFYQGQDITEPKLAHQPTKSNFIDITYIGGYKYPSENEKGDVPASLKLALVGLINNYVDSLSQEGKLKSYSRDDVSYTFKDTAERNSAFISILNRYISL